MLVHRPYIVADGPNPKRISPWRGPFYTEEATASIVARREGREPTPFSPGSALLALPVEPEELVMPL